MTTEEKSNSMYPPEWWWAERQVIRQKQANLLENDEV